MPIGVQKHGARFKNTTINKVSTGPFPWVHIRVKKDKRISEEIKEKYSVNTFSKDFALPNH